MNILQELDVVIFEVHFRDLRFEEVRHEHQGAVHEIAQVREELRVDLK